MKLLNDAIDLIEKNLFYDYSIDEISNELHYSKYHLSRIFNTIVGYSIPMYTKLRRLSEAALLLDDDKYQVSDIAFKCGYNSVSYFISGFKEVFGITPLQYRKGKCYIHLLKRINIGGKEMFNDIENLNNHILKEYDDTKGLFQLFSTLDNVVLDKIIDTSIHYFALLKEEKGNALWECELNLLTGIADKAIIANDKNNPWIMMKKLHKQDDCISVECLNEKNQTTHEGTLVHIGKPAYLVDMCRIEDDYIKQMDHYVNEQPSESSIHLMIKEIESLFSLKNDQELREYILKTPHIEILRLVNKKVLIVYLINNKQTFTIFDALCDLDKKTYAINCNSGFNNFNKKGSFYWHDNMLEVHLDNQYFSQIQLGTGDVYALYNSSHAIEFENQRRGLSSISFETK